MGLRGQNTGKLGVLTAALGLHHAAVIRLAAPFQPILSVLFCVCVYLSVLSAVFCLPLSCLSFPSGCRV